MKPLELIGQVGAATLRDMMRDVSESDDVAMFKLDCLTGEQAAAVVNSVLADATLAAQFTIAMPRALVAGHGLPSHVVTDEKSVALRHASCATRALLLANVEDEQGTSLQDIAAVGPAELGRAAKAWVDAGSAGLTLPVEQLSLWEVALAGLVGPDERALVQIALFVAMTREAVELQGKPILDALGWALPALQLPRDSGYFIAAIRPRDLMNPARWTRAFEKLVVERKTLLFKQRPNRQPIEGEELRAQWNEYRDEVPEAQREVFERFIDAPQGWTDASTALCELEWNSERVAELFSGLKRRQAGLGPETLTFFEDEFPNGLDSSEKRYLKQLTKRTPLDVDREFFNDHHHELGERRPLRAKWERFIFGRAVECTDFLDGLLQVMQRLDSQAEKLVGKKSLTIRCSRRKVSQWNDLNAYLGLAFVARYRGLNRLTSTRIKWDCDRLFDFDTFLEERKAKVRKYEYNESVARANRQLKFEVTLTVGDGPSADNTSIQLIWTGHTNRIDIELFSDLGRLVSKPFPRMEVARESVNKKGQLQNLSLDDVTTLQGAFRQDAGSLVGRNDKSIDIEREFKKALGEFAKDGRISADAAKDIETSWGEFAAAYRNAIAGLAGQGLAYPGYQEQAAAYGRLLDCLREKAPGDIFRLRLWEPVLQIGCAKVLGDMPASIVTPWHPLRMAGTSVKVRSVTNLLNHFVEAEQVNFGDDRLFFSDLRQELQHPYYPEIAVGYRGQEAVLLAEVSTVAEYSLMERPVRDDGISTDVDPKEAANEVRLLLERYTNLQPHERSNLSVMLYNCDAAKLPLAVVNALSAVDDEEELNCSVLVRHQDRERVASVYTDLLDRAEDDPDAVIASEMSQNFMAKMRIGVVVDGGGSGANGREVDIAFLHDVVSREAREEWIEIGLHGVVPSFNEHVPPRWSYRRASKEDELKGVIYLACPRQPEAGWSYVNTVASVVRKQSVIGRWLPARQISFQDDKLRAMFDEVHKVAEWVATYDDLLDRRQLQAQQVRIIRYRRHRSNGRNMIVSSKSDLRVLHVLVRRRLGELELGLDDGRLDALAQRMIDEALAISGDIVFRAAKRGVSAGELIGLVLSRALMREEFQGSDATAWFLLDDYARWLGQQEEGIADILGLAVCEGADGARSLRVAVSEAKYVASAGVPDARKTSRGQLVQTLQRIEEALFGDPGRLDRDLWLSRLADLIMDGQALLGKTHTLEQLRDGMRKGEVGIDIRGYSHVFASTDGSQASEQEPIPQVCDGRGLQEFFSREDLKKLVLAFEARSPLTPVREGLGAARPWSSATVRQPAPRVNWVVGTLPPASEGAGKPAEEAGDAITAAPEPNVERPSTQSETAAETPTRPKKSTTGALGELVASRVTERASATETESAWLTEAEQRLRNALLGYNLQAKLLGSRLTPNAALVRFAGSDRLSLQDVRGLESKLLTTHGLRLVTLAALPGEIVIGVERPKRQVVSQWDLWDRRALNVNEAGQNTSFVIGLRELDGEILYLNLGGAFGGAKQHDPHTLVAGATGSGKSVLIQALLLDICATNSSKLARVYLIDPKMGVDYAALEGLPHMEGGVIVDQQDAIATFDRLIAEMERRYELFRTAKARDLKTYNSKVDESQRLPLLFLIHDEFAEWMLIESYRDAVTASVQRLGVKARAAGIYLVFAAQRPDANVLPIQLRDNLGNRLILKVASVGTSEIALGEKGAETLLGLGHMAAKLSGEPDLIFAQAPFLSDDDIERAVEAIRQDNGAKN